MISPREVPPYCFLKPGVPLEVAAAHAAKHHDMEFAIDLLITLWELRRAVTAAESTDPDGQKLSKM